MTQSTAAEGAAGIFIQPAGIPTQTAVMTAGRLAAVQLDLVAGICTCVQLYNFFYSRYFCSCTAIPCCKAALQVQRLALLFNIYTASLQVQCVALMMSLSTCSASTTGTVYCSVTVVQLHCKYKRYHYCCTAALQVQQVL